MQKTFHDQQSEKRDILSLKQGIKQELQGEEQLIQDIQFIALKYKKLLAE